MFISICVDLSAGIDEQFTRRRNQVDESGRQDQAVTVCPTTRQTSSCTKSAVTIPGWDESFTRRPDRVQVSAFFCFYGKLSENVGLHKKCIGLGQFDQKIRSDYAIFRIIRS